MRLKFFCKGLCLSESNLSDRHLSYMSNKIPIVKYTLGARAARPHLPAGQTEECEIGIACASTVGCKRTACLRASRPRSQNACLKQSFGIHVLLPYR